MNAGFRRNTPSWHAPESRIVRPELWVLAVAVVGTLLVEVWQSSRMAELCLALDISRSALTQERSLLEYDRGRLEHGRTRAQLDPLAAKLGLAPIDGARQIELPADYLASEIARPAADQERSPVAWLDRLSRALVPEATARSRSGS